MGEIILPKMGHWDFSHSTCGLNDTATKGKKEQMGEIILPRMGHW